MKLTINHSIILEDDHLKNCPCFGIFKCHSTKVGGAVSMTVGSVRLDIYISVCISTDPSQQTPLLIH
ncbi:hypothetical protein BLOT_009605 [Blomia tropicalis]|nr:hypothetical protein BLOT_009605 [Blomia tropicalis]